MALAELCPDLASWPQHWHIEPADLSFGTQLVDCLTPFLLQLLSQGRTRKTLQRHRDHVWMLGGELIRRRHDNPDLRRHGAEALLLQLLDDDCGPLIWPRISEQQQNVIDATCRQLYRFLIDSSLQPNTQ